MIVVTIVVAVLAVATVAFVLRDQRATRARVRTLGRQLEQARAALARREEQRVDAERRLETLVAAQAAADEVTPPPAIGAAAMGAAPGVDAASGVGAWEGRSWDSAGTPGSELQTAAEVGAAPAPDHGPGAGADDPGSRAAAREGDGSLTPSDPARVLESLWALTALEQARARRFAEALSTAPPRNPPDGLTAGLEDEVGRLREEAGTPGTLRVVLDAEPAPGDAELLLRSVQALLAVLSRHCQAYDLYVHQWEDRLLGVLVCEGFDGPDSVADETSDVLAALAPVDGRIELDRDPQGRLRARLSIPAH
ncbi:hypothetical protein K6U06_09320 [Acidiferrimicrobium sp. IK]|uniref:hypothetical protein n=1 Tax=Acidiferrimicrobium sp. IK TaxID=2871700 RepID=UPI0021CB0526|nr:hypothetical protein [Acidiferrimicrobium sp. IK]MCU4184559.1 hypothetical protein [Acidiferrimicrobium sp. IK]